MRRAFYLVLALAVVVAIFAGGWWLGRQGFEPPGSGAEESQDPATASPAPSLPAGARLPGAPIDPGVTVGTGRYTKRLDAGDVVDAAEVLAAFGRQQDDGFVPTFSIQAGAFVDPESAQGLTDRLAARGYSPEILVETTDSGAEIHLVRVGRFSSHRKAALAAALFSQREEVTAVAVRDHFTEIHELMSEGEPRPAEQPTVDLDAIEAGSQPEADSSEQPSSPPPAADPAPDR